MGYYARGSGSITFNKGLDDTDVKRIADLLDLEYFEYDFYKERREKNSKNPPRLIGVDFWQDDKYDGDSVEKILGEIAKVAPIKDGELKYIGEDDSIWRFRFIQDGGWIEENGRIVYE